MMKCKKQKEKKSLKAAEIIRTHTFFPFFVPGEGCPDDVPLREELSLDQDLNVISRHMLTMQLWSTINRIGTVGRLPGNMMYPVFIHMYLLYVSIRGAFVAHACVSNQSGICSIGM